MADEPPATAGEPLRILSFGPIPPDWGGKSRGGVATTHQTLLAEFARRGGTYGVEVAGLVPLNLAPGASPRPPIPVFFPAEGVSDAAFYEETLERVGPDLVVFHHISHRWAVVHARAGAPVPGLGLVKSWHSVTSRSGEAARRSADLIREALRGLAGVVFPSWHCLHEGESLGFTYPSVRRVIPNPLHPTYTEPGIDPGRGGRGGVAFVGSLVARKNPVALVEAVREIDGLELAVAGEGPEETSLRKLVDAWDLSSRVRFLGSCAPRDIRELLRKSEALCLPSRSESFGIVFIEALACGTPVVGFAPMLDEIQSYLDVPCGEPVYDGTPEEIESAIQRVLGTQWDRRTLRTRACEQFSATSIASSYAETFRRVSVLGRQRL